MKGLVTELMKYINPDSQLEKLTYWSNTFFSWLGTYCAPCSVAITYSILFIPLHQHSGELYQQHGVSKLYFEMIMNSRQCYFCKIQFVHEIYSLKTVCKTWGVLLNKTCYCTVLKDKISQILNNFKLLNNSQK